MLSQEERAAKLAALEKRMSGVWNPEEGIAAGPQAGNTLEGLAAEPAAAAASLPAAAPASSTAATDLPAASGDAAAFVAASVPAAEPPAVTSSPAMPPALPVAPPSSEAHPLPPPAVDPSLPPPPSLAEGSSMPPPPPIAKGTPVILKPVVLPPLGQKQVSSAADTGKAAVIVGQASAMSQPSQAKPPVAANVSTVSGVKTDLAGAAASKAPAPSQPPAGKWIQASAVNADPSEAADSKAPASSNPMRSNSAAPAGKTPKAPGVKLDPAGAASGKVPAPSKPAAAKPAAIAAKFKATSTVKTGPAGGDKKLVTAAANGSTSAGPAGAAEAKSEEGVSTSGAAGSQQVLTPAAVSSAPRATARNHNSLVNGSNANTPRGAQPSAALHANAGGLLAASKLVADIKPESVPAPPALKPDSSMAQHLGSSAAGEDQVRTAHDVKARETSEHASSGAVGAPGPPMISQPKAEPLSEASATFNHGVDGSSAAPLLQRRPKSVAPPQAEPQLHTDAASGRAHAGAIQLQCNGHAGSAHLAKSGTSPAAIGASRRAGSDNHGPAKRATSPALELKSRVPYVSSADRSDSKHGPVREVSQNGSATLPGPPSKRPRLDRSPSRRPSSADASSSRVPHRHERATDLQKWPSSASAASQGKPDARPSTMSRLSRGSLDNKASAATVQQHGRSRDNQLENLEQPGSARQVNGSASSQPHGTYTEHRQSSKLDGKQHEWSHRERYGHDTWRRVSRPDSQERPPEVSCLRLRRCKRHCLQALWSQLQACQGDHD